MHKLRNEEIDAFVKKYNSFNYSKTDRRNKIIAKVILESDYFKTLTTTNQFVTGLISAIKSLLDAYFTTNPITSGEDLKFLQAQTDLENLNTQQPTQEQLKQREDSRTAKTMLLKQSKSKSPVRPKTSIASKPKAPKQSDNNKTVIVKSSSKSKITRAITATSFSRPTISSANHTVSRYSTVQSSVDRSFSSSGRPSITVQ